jgi:hypothetical protein
VIQSAEIADDAGKGGANDALVERGQEHACHEPAQYDEDLFMR